MPARNTTRKRKKKSSNNSSNKQSAQNATNSTSNVPDKPSNVYETEPNRSWINVRFWKNIMGCLAALLVYYFAAFHPHLMIKGPAKKLIGPLLASPHGDKECVKLNTFGRTCLIFWSFHFLRRLFEGMLMQTFYRYAPHSEITGTIIMCTSLAVFNGVCNNIHIWFRQNWQCASMANIALGLCIFFIGEFGNSYHHYLLKKCRSKYQKNVDSEFKGHVIPKGGMFDYISCPHYLFEIITWFGWMFICQFSTGSIITFSITLGTLMMKAMEVHSVYKQKFTVFYPPNRRALIPFVF